MTATDGRGVAEHGIPRDRPCRAHALRRALARARMVARAAALAEATLL